ncbi:alpha/beta hydrolase [Leptolyngbya sp. SLC-A1]|uniref:alpha/beta fold hydrolase n=2 Tax=Cyanophyceae TaxID=3028117 RepID=UPI0016880E10|nr:MULTISPECIES: alpha/beta hydrolase [Cyanophyceae]MBD1919418.1 alpha/beta hydrolase [Phormidium sp. FACHB-77]MBD2035224.1 alpha/beta hydrolase [Leptolyngbya sp. FACHB-321]MBD2054348.1 alpha/beta hydrolase [Leptolyngbya sp. FACHB-60]
MNMLTLRKGIRLLLVVALFLGTTVITFLGVTMNTASAQDKPTIVLIHGAFAESSSWNGVLSELITKGYPTIAVANPLRGVQSDADYVASVLSGIEGLIVLVGHSYGGAVITNAVNDDGNVKALVYVAGFAPDTGETAAELSGRYPGSTLGPTLAPPVELPDGGKDLYIQQDKFHAQFAADLPTSDTQLMASTQRPITEAALNEGSGEPAWKSIPSWFIYGERDLNIPAAAQAFMAERANSKETVVVRGASHVVMVSHPDAVVELIEHAAADN